MPEFYEAYMYHNGNGSSSKASIVGESIVWVTQISFGIGWHGHSLIWNDQ